MQVSKKHRDAMAEMLSMSTDKDTIVRIVLEETKDMNLDSERLSNLNNISLKAWDHLGCRIWGEYPSKLGPRTLSGRVCLLKEVVRQIQDGTIQRVDTAVSLDQPLSK
tara:strand:- start:55 stop:378 length:324 start_codon:yes stop_codon:yes gene_type:complete